MIKLPLPLFKKKEETSQYFLSILLRDEKVSAFVFKEGLGKLRLIGKGEEQFTGSIEDSQTEELIEVIDGIISTAEGALPPNVETQKTVFGLKDNWIEDGKIKTDYLVKLKKICDTLGLDPIGFLTISEAIIHVLEKEEGAPVSAVLVEAGQKTVSVSLIRASNIAETRKADIEYSLPATVENILKHFTSVEVLPARIILFDASSVGNGGEKIVQEFIGFSWNKTLPFLHIPQVQILPSEFDAHALLVGTATQMGFDVLDNGQKLFPEDLKENTPAHHETPPKQTSSKTGTPEDFGFVRNKDITETPVAIPKAEPIQEELKNEITEPDNSLLGMKNLETPQRKLPSSNDLEKYFGIVVNRIKEISSKIKTPVLPSLSLTVPTGKGMFLVISLIGIILGLVLLYLFALKAEVILIIQPKILTQTQDFTITNNAKTDFSLHRINGQTKSVSEEGSLTVQTTGKKEIGEKSKGTIFIYNSDLTDGKTFAKGTKITAPNNLAFTLDEEAKLASASGDASSIRSSTAKVAVTGEEIGKEYNMPSNTKFTIANFASSLVIGKNDTAFSGGSKKEVASVSQKDLDTLTSELPKKYDAKDREKLQKSIGKDESLISNHINVELSKKSFSKKLNDEADKVTLTATVSYSGIVYRTKDLQEYARFFIKDRITSDLVLSENSIKTQVKDISKKEDDSFKATLEVKALLTPKIDSQKLTDSIKGASFEDAESKLSNIKDTSVTIELQPNLPFLPHRLPILSKNISVIQEVNE